MKTCIKCGEEKEATTEFFPKKKSHKDGFAGTCKACGREYAKVYCKANSEKVKATSKVWHKANSEKVKVARGIWRATNPEKKKAADKAWYADNIEKVKAASKTWRENNSERVKAFQRARQEANPEKKANAENKANIRAWNQAHPEKRRQSAQRYKARKRSLLSTLTLEQWANIKRHFNNCCAYCGNNSLLTQDHLVPLSKGGEYTHNNIIPACKSCNSSKGPRSFFEWYPKYRYYSKKREKAILEYLNYDKQNNQQLALI